MHLPLSILYVLYQSIYYTPDFISYEERLAKFVQSCTWCKPKTATNPIRGLLRFMYNKVGINVQQFREIHLYYNFYEL